MTQLMDRPARGTAPARRDARRHGVPAAPTRAPASARGGAVPAQPHEWRTLAAVSLAVLGVLLVATWSFAQGWGRGPVPGPGELAVDSGLLRVDGVVSAAPPQHAMPGMGTDEDPVPDGYRRVSVDVTLLAGTAAMTYDRDLFHLEVEGEAVEHLAHRDVLPVETLPPGTRLSGTMLFDVPQDATTATLGYDGSGSTELVLPAEAEGPAAGAPAEQPTTGGGHGAGHHPSDVPQDGAGAGR